MAQSSQSLLYICRSCQSQLRKSSLSFRSFSTSRQQNRTIPSFTPTSSEELNEILLTFRQKVFTPAALANHHRALIYKKSRHAILLNDPGVTVTLSNDEEIKLEPMERFDRPHKRKSLHKIGTILGNSPEIEAWKNLPAFLEGMKQSHETIDPSFFERITRKATEMDRAGIIIRCAEMVKKTNFTLANTRVTRALLLGCHDDAAAAKFKGEELDAALRRAKIVTRLLEEGGHCGGKLEAGKVDMRRDPVVIGVLLELLSAKALDTNAEVDDINEVSSYVTKILALGEDAVPAKEEINSDKVSSKSAAILERASSNRHLENLLPIWNGTKLAAQVVKGEQQTQLQSLISRAENDVNHTVAELRAKADGKPRKALLMYEQLI